MDCIKWRRGVWSGDGFLFFVSLDPLGLGKPGGLRGGEGWDLEP